MSSKLCHALNYRIIIDLSFHFLYAVQHSIQINSKTVSCRQQPYSSSNGHTYRVTRPYLPVASRLIL